MSRVAQQAVTDYFDVLLSEPEAKPALDAAPQPDPLQRARLSALLAQATPVSEPDPVAVEPSLQLEPEPAPAEPAPARFEATVALKSDETIVTPGEVAEADWKAALESRFQCLYFKVAGLTLAVPLQLLGGIKRLGELSQIPGSAPWMLGIQAERERKLQVVDSGRWLMPQKAAQERPYRYLVQLGNSPWALACESLVNAEPLDKAQVQWQQPGTDSRRYLAGIVRERMCVVLDVPQTISLLEAGKDISIKES
ncbi:chemotaxis protein CheW [Ferrimonas balearica]|uniref:chemotaxis protein CheW n=1 Tax=Ferrimonas balearica TaxID=44012 RepID=UPI001C990BAE|nr:chemotaxis protein CheW [Ferrimonas balearica]MBY5990756.1 chemotaxis protein CheW [Ferrimonas balearica]